MTADHKKKIDFIYANAYLELTDVSEKSHEPEDPNAPHWESFHSFALLSLLVEILYDHLWVLLNPVHFYFLKRLGKLNWESQPGGINPWKTFPQPINCRCPEP